MGEEIPRLAGSQQQVETSRPMKISQLEEIPHRVEISQQEETSRLEEIPQLAGSPQLAEIPQHGRAQLRQIQQHSLPANASTRVAALSTTVGANALTSRRTSTGGG